MSDRHTDLVVQISTAVPETLDKVAAQPHDSQLIKELRQCLQPGVEIALVFHSYMAITSILWLSDLQPDGSVRAGVRLLAVSALADKSKAAQAWSECPQSVPDTSLESSVLSHSV